MPNKYQIISDFVVSDVYGEKFGWRMFSNNFLTEPIANFLACEVEEFTKFIDSHINVKTIVEVGCGYGRFSQVVKQSGRSYIGIDLISWLIELGKWITPSLNEQRHNILSASVVDLDKVLSSFSYSKADISQTTVFLPFNCLGNIQYLEHILSKLSCLGVNVLASLFNPTNEASKARCEYYVKCGLDHPNIAKNEYKGVTISSYEGFDSIGFNHSYIVDLMKKYNYHLEDSVPLSSLGHLSHFKLNGVLERQNIASVSLGICYQKSRNINQVNLSLTQKPIKFFGIDFYSISDFICPTTKMIKFSEKTFKDTNNWKHELIASNFLSPIIILETKNILNGNISFVPIKMY